MSLIKLNCPNCGGTLELDDTREFAFCHYCGNKVMIQRDINHIIVNNSNDTQVIRLVKIIKTHLSVKDYDNALKLLDELSRMDSTYPELYLLYAEATVIKTNAETGDASPLILSSKLDELLAKYKTYSGVTMTTEQLLERMGLNNDSFYRDLRAMLNEGRFEEAKDMLLERYRTLGSNYDEIRDEMYSKEELYHSCLNMFMEFSAKMLVSLRYYPKFYEDFVFGHISKMFGMKAQDLNRLIAEVTIKARITKKEFDDALFESIVYHLKNGEANNYGRIVYFNNVFSNDYYPDYIELLVRACGECYGNIGNAPGFISDMYDTAKMTKMLQEYHNMYYADEFSGMRQFTKHAEEEFRRSHPPIEKKGLFGTKTVPVNLTKGWYDMVRDVFYRNRNASREVDYSVLLEHMIYMSH